MISCKRPRLGITSARIARASVPALGLSLATWIAAAEARSDHIMYVSVPRDVPVGDVLHPSESLKRRLLTSIPATTLGGQQRADHGDSSDDRIVIFTDVAGTPILPERAKSARRAASASATAVPRELSFTFDSPDVPWSSEELATLTTAVNAFYPMARTIYGEPAFDLTVNIRKDPNSPFVGLYFPSLNEMVLSSSQDLSVLCHEMIHAFRDDDVVGLSSFEEGMTRAAEIEVFNRLDDYVWPQGDHHAYTYDVYYEALDTPTIGSYAGNFFAGYVSPLLRYQLAGYAWGKALIENPEFFADFNAQLYAAALVDPTATYTEAKLLEILKTVQARVEELPVATWYERQGVLNTAPSEGHFLYQRINQFTIDYFARDATGTENMQAGATIEWAVYDSQENLLDAGSDVTSANGFISFQPALPPQYTGRIQVVATTDSAEGLVTNTAVRAAGADSGVFGIVRDADAGALTIISLDHPDAPVTASVLDGAFYAPSLAAARGRFLAVFTDPQGRRFSEAFTKDASDYFLDMESDPHGMLGNCNVDSTPVVDIFDILASIDIILGRVSPTVSQVVQCDTTCDETMDIFDVLRSIDALIGRLPNPPLCLASTTTQ